MQQTDKCSQYFIEFTVREQQETDDMNEKIKSATTTSEEKKTIMSKINDRKSIKEGERDERRWCAAVAWNLAYAKFFSFAD